MWLIFEISYVSNIWDRLCPVQPGDSRSLMWPIFKISKVAKSPGIRDLACSRYLRSLRQTIQAGHKRSPKSLLFRILRSKIQSTCRVGYIRDSLCLTHQRSLMSQISEISYVSDTGDTGHSRSQISCTSEISHIGDLKYLTHSVSQILEILYVSKPVRKYTK